MGAFLGLLTQTRLSATGPVLGGQIAKAAVPHLRAAKLAPNGREGSKIFSTSPWKGALLFGLETRIAMRSYRVAALLKGHIDQARSLNAAFAKAENIAERLRKEGASQRLALLTPMDLDVRFLEDSVMIRIPSRALLGMLDVDADDQGYIDLICHAVRIRRGHEIKLVIRDSGKANLPVQRDEKLVSLLAEAFAARDLVLGRSTQSINQIAKEEGRCRTRLAKLFALAHLAPSIVKAILDGRQPATLTAKDLREIDLPIAWDDQRQLLGFG